MAIHFYQFGIPCQRSASGPNLGGLHPEFRFRLWRALNDPRLEGSAAYSGLRSNSHQASLRVSNGCPDVYTAPASSCRVPTAIPGRSLHNERPVGFDWGNLVFEVQWGIAADISFRDTEDKWIPPSVVDPIMSEYGMHRIQSETWHWQPNKDFGDLQIIVGEGSRGQRVKNLQTALNDVAGSGLIVDGDYGAKTGDSVAAFQETHGRPVRRDWAREDQQVLGSIRRTTTPVEQPSPQPVGPDPSKPVEALRQIRAIANRALD